MKILIIDDDAKLLRFLGQGLAELGVDSLPATSAEQALEVLRRERFELILLDVMLPGASGWEFLETLRAGGDETPVIFVTARQEVDERVRGLRLGADDYIIKPFELDELVARIEAVLRRRSARVMALGDLRLDLQQRTVERDGRRVDLTPREFDLLLRLAQAHGEVVSRAELLHDVWGIDFDPGTNLVNVQVARLRKRLDLPDEPSSIQAVVGQGYRFVPPARSRP